MRMAGKPDSIRKKEAVPMMRLALATLALAATAAAVDQSSAVTFTKDVLPILQKNCQSCHRPGQVAPMSLVSYQETRPWARAIKSAVTTNQTAISKNGRLSHATRRTEYPRARPSTA